MNENKRMRQARSGSVVACFAVIASLLVGARAMAVVTVKVATDDGPQGGVLHMTLSVTRQAGDGSLASLNTDVIFNNAQLDLIGNCSDNAACRTSADCGTGDFCRFIPTACQKDPRLTDQTVEVIPPDFQNVQPGQRRIRFAIVATRLPVPTFTDGSLVTCTFQIPASAPIGPITLSTDRLQVADNAIPSKPVAAQAVVEAGQITGAVTPNPTVKATDTPIGGGPTATLTPGTPSGATPTRTPVTPGGGSPTPTSRPGQCADPRPAPAGPAIYVVDHNLTAAGDVTVEVKLAAGGEQVAGTQNDLAFGSGIRIKAKANGKPDCTVNPAISKNGTSFGFRPPMCSGDACVALRALVLATDNTDAIADGSVLYTCNATVTATATLGNTGVIFSDPNGERINGVTGRDGIFCIGGPQPPTATATHIAERTPSATASSTVKPTASHTAGVATATPSMSIKNPTATPSDTTNPNGSGGGCHCSVESIDSSRGGWSSFWLMMPAALLFWRRRPTR